MLVHQLKKYSVQQWKQRILEIHQMFIFCHHDIGESMYNSCKPGSTMLNAVEKESVARISIRTRQFCLREGILIFYISRYFDKTYVAPCVRSLCKLSFAVRSSALEVSTRLAN